MRYPDRQDTCGCGGAGKPVGENKPLRELRRLIEMLERQEAEKRQTGAGKFAEQESGDSLNPSSIR
jgi:hypothetical protein